MKSLKWTTKESRKLFACVSKYGPRRWDWISQVLRDLGTDKSGNSCMLRWKNYLREGVVRTGFTVQEKHKILLLHSLGNGWAKIAQHMPGRSDNAIKNYWNTQLTREARELGLEVASEEFLQIMTERYANTTANLPPESSSPSDFRGDAESSYPPSAFRGGALHPSVFEGGGGGGGESSYAAATTTLQPSAFEGGGGESSSPPDFGGGGESSCTTTIPPSAFDRGGESSYALHPSVFEGGGGESSSPSAFGGGGAFAELSPLSFDFSLELGNDGWDAPFDGFDFSLELGNDGFDYSNSEGGGGESSYTTTTTLPPSPSAFGGGGAFVESSHISTTTLPPSAFGGSGGAYVGSFYTTTTTPLPSAFGGGAGSSSNTSTMLPPSAFGDAFTEHFSGWGAPFDADYPNFENPAAYLSPALPEASVLPFNGQQLANHELCACGAAHPYFCRCF